ncbi:hypothetical protein N2152v2_010444 [Parachlorella kessleri]
MDYRWDVVRRKEIEAQRKQEELRVLERLLAKLKDGHGADQGAIQQKNTQSNSVAKENKELAVKPQKAVANKLDKRTGRLVPAAPPAVLQQVMEQGERQVDMRAELERLGAKIDETNDLLRKLLLVNVQHPRG